jgi:hypothetical protein
LLLFVLLIPVAGFVLGIVALLRVRLESGDVYPPYSTLRRDPLGTRILYESLDEMPGMYVSRNFEPLVRRPMDQKAALLLCGASVEMVKRGPSAFFEHLNRFVTGGGRLLIAFEPRFGPRWFDVETEEDEAEDEDSDERADSPPEEKPSPEEDTQPEQEKKDIRDLLDEDIDWLRTVKMEEVWGVAFQYQERTPAVWETMDPEDGIPDPVDAGVEAETGAMTWPSGLYFELLDEDWKTIFTKRGRPVLIERRMGKGALIMASDSYFLSNQAMVQDRRLDLLAYVIGPHQRVIFDESHLGIVEEPGIMVLALKYRLQGLLTALAVLTVLFVWKSASNLVPPREAADRTDDRSVGGKEAFEGFVNLLRRNVPSSRLLETCLGEWERATATAGRESLQGKRERMRRVVARPYEKSRRSDEIVSRYRELTRILEEREKAS